MGHFSQKPVLQPISLLLKIVVLANLKVKEENKKIKSFNKPTNKIGESIQGPMHKINIYLYCEQGWSNFCLTLTDFLDQNELTVHRP